MAATDGQLHHTFAQGQRRRSPPTGFEPVPLPGKSGSHDLQRLPGVLSQVTSGLPPDLNGPVGYARNFEPGVVALAPLVMRRDVEPTSGNVVDEATHRAVH